MLMLVMMMNIQDILLLLVFPERQNLKHSQIVPVLEIQQFVARKRTARTAHLVIPMMTITNQENLDRNLAIRLKYLQVVEHLPLLNSNYFEIIDAYSKQKNSFTHSSPQEKFLLLLCEFFFKKDIFLFSIKKKEKKSF